MPVAILEDDVDMNTSPQAHDAAASSLVLPSPPWLRSVRAPRAVAALGCHSFPSLFRLRRTLTHTCRADHRVERLAACGWLIPMCRVWGAGELHMAVGVAHPRLLP